MILKKGILSYRYEKNTDETIIIYAHWLHRFLAFIIDIVILIITGTIVGSILSIAVVGPMIYKAQSRGVSGNVDLFLYAGLIIIFLLLGFGIATYIVSNYCSKHGYSIGQKIFSLQTYHSENHQPTLGASSIMGKEILFWIVFWITLLFIIPFIILIIFTVFYFIWKSGKKMWRDHKIYLGYATKKNEYLIAQIPK